MDIGNMLNSKNAAAAAAAEAQLQQQLAHEAHFRGANMNPDHSSNVQHGDPHLYNSNGHQPLHPISNLPPPSQAPHGMPMMQNGYLSIKQENAYSQNDASGSRSPGEGPPKAFICSTCPKGFARRSDLARHGKCIHTVYFRSRLIFEQSVSTVTSDRMSAILMVVTSDSFNDQP